MADIDSLSGLPARASFDAALLEALVSARERNEPLGLLMIDVDHFKRVNDMHGHVKGDDVLKATAESLRQSVRDKGTAYRYGGEEFGIVLKNHSENESVAVAERIRRDMESESKAGLQLTVSIGVAVFPVHGMKQMELIQRADEALYDAKNRGRNLVRVYGEPAPVRESREPERKRAEAGPLTQSEREAIRKKYFRDGWALCPHDEAQLTITELNALGRVTPGLMVWCKLCGLTDEA